MDHIDEQDEELASGTFEYVVPLHGESPSPGVGRSADSEESTDFDNGGKRRSSTQRGTGNSGWNAPHRRSPHETDPATPQQQNKSRFAKISEDAQAGRGLPPIPFNDRSERSLGMSQNGLGDFLANNNNSTVKFDLDQDGSESAPSLPLHAVFGGPSTPTSNAASSFSKRTPDRSRRSAQQIGMDGAIRELPLSPGSMAEESTMHSRGGSQSHHSSKKHRSESHPLSSSSSRERQLMHASMHSGTSYATEHYPIDRTKEHDGASIDEEDNISLPIMCCGFVAPVWLSALIRGSPSLDRISRYIVHVLPCFWCCALTTPESYSDRAVVIRLTILCLVMTSVQVIMSMWLAVVLLIVDDEPGALRGFAPHLWNLNGATFSMGILASILMLTCSCTIRVMREVDLVGAIRYLWVILWIVPFEIFFNISLYDYHNVTTVWIRHW
jgi:hypothetical protein